MSGDEVSVELAPACILSLVCFLVSLAQPPAPRWKGLYFFSAAEPSSLVLGTEKMLGWCLERRQGESGLERLEDRSPLAAGWDVVTAAVWGQVCGFCHSVPAGPGNQTVEASNTTVKPSATSTTEVSGNTTASTTKSTATSKMTTPALVPTNMTSTAKPSIPQNTTQVSTSTIATAHNSSVTSVSSSVTITATIHSKSKGSKFDTGSFVGGIVLTLGVLSVLYVGCKMYYSRRGIRYRTIDEHDAII
ncbi:porimin [Carlito syrichta]|uniref:Porimin n=1 Tax=Carlito syrichta TaxID=1868482 RepID=A0A3Q0DJK6_CARSF|nr:porimin [Carlito syrichta]